jgi:hypothetical protein
LPFSEDLEDLSDKVDFGVDFTPKGNFLVLRKFLKQPKMAKKPT